MSSKGIFHRAGAAVAVALAWAVAPALGAEATGSAAVAAVARGDYAVAVRVLGQLEASDRATFRANNQDYLLGRVLEHQGDLAAASARYTDVIERGSNLSEYALWRLANIARLEGNLPLERRHLTRLIAR